MINSKHFFSFVATSLVLATLAFSSYRWGLPLLKKVTDDSTVHITNSQAKKPSVPEEFINISTESDDSDEEHIHQKFSNLPTQILWQNLLSSLQDDKPAQINLEKALIMRLRKESSSAVYDDLLLRFRQQSINSDVQQVLLSLLGEVGNFKAAETLMRLVSEELLQDNDAKLAAFHAISKFAPESWREHSNTELAPIFEAAWQQTKDPEFLSAIANVLASIGAPSTLDLFVQTLTDNTNEDRIDIVQQAATNLSNPVLIPKLVDILHNSKVENVRITSGYTLANMGQIEAATALLDWSKQIDVNQVDLVKIWFENAMNTTPEFVAYLEDNLSTQSFASQDIKKAVEEVLQDVKSGVE